MLGAPVQALRRARQKRNQVANGRVSQSRGQPNRHDRRRTGPNLLNLRAGDHGRFRVRIGDANRQRPSARTTPTSTCPSFVATVKRRVVRLDERARRGDVAVDLGAAFPADVGQIRPDLAPLPSKRMALRTSSSFARKKLLALGRVSAGEVGNHQRRRRRLAPAARVPRARRLAVAQAPCRTCLRRCGMRP